jgi:hypothetical protein
LGCAHKTAGVVLGEKAIGAGEALKPSKAITARGIGVETTAFIDIRFERIFGTTTIGFRNTRVIPYLVSTSFISLVGTGAALFFLSGGVEENISSRDVSWAIWTWAIGAYLHFPVMLWLRGSKEPRCQYCQERMPERGEFCRICDEKYDLTGAHRAAEEHIMNHIRAREEDQPPQTQVQKRGL